MERWWIVDQETRWWNDDKWDESVVQRGKEDAMDYRYFPEPDLLPIELDDDFIEECRKVITRITNWKRLRYLNEYKLSEDDARILTTDKELSDYFDEFVELTKDPKKSCSYITTVFLALIKGNEKYKVLQI